MYKITNLGKSPIPFDVNKESEVYKSLVELLRTGKKSKTIRAAQKQGRNELCACGSSLKYKNCCGK